MAINIDELFMDMAVKNAIRAFEGGDIPVGAVIVNEGVVIGQGYNMVMASKDPTAHAEIIAIGSASSYLQRPYLDDSTLYVNVEPCVMCMGAIINSRISRVVFLVKEPKYGFSNFFKAPDNIQIEIMENAKLCEITLKMLRERFHRK